MPFVALSLGNAVIAQGWDRLDELKDIASEQLCALAATAAMAGPHVAARKGASRRAAGTRA